MLGVKTFLLFFFSSSKWFSRTLLGFLSCTWTCTSSSVHRLVLYGFIVSMVLVGMDSNMRVRWRCYLSNASNSFLFQFECPLMCMILSFWKLFNKIKSNSLLEIYRADCKSIIGQEELANVCSICPWIPLFWGLNSWKRAVSLLRFQKPPHFVCVEPF